MENLQSKKKRIRPHKLSQKLSFFLMVHTELKLLWLMVLRNLKVMVKLRNLTYLCATL
jgi:hypothetical protein